MIDAIFTSAMGEFRMPICSQCTFYKPKDAKTGECVNTGQAIPSDNDTARCPIRMFVPK
jgi:hypothetical protein